MKQWNIRDDLGMWTSIISQTRSGPKQPKDVCLDCLEGAEFCSYFLVAFIGILGKASDRLDSLLDVVIFWDR